MLKPAQLYKDELNKKMVEGWYDIENMYYHSGPFAYSMDVADNNSDVREFVCIDGERLIGYISYNVDYMSMSADNFGFISFDKGNVTLVKDVFNHIKDLFHSYHFNRVAWYCYADNPAIRGYRNFIQKFGGKEVGYLRQSTKLLDGKLHDSVIFEILKSDLKQ